MARGRYPSLSAVLQHGLELLRAQTEKHDAALKALLEQRAKGPFISMEESDAQIERMIAEFSERDLEEGDALQR